MDAVVLFTTDEQEGCHWDPPQWQSQVADDVAEEEDGKEVEELLCQWQQLEIILTQTFHLPDGLLAWLAGGVHAAMVIKMKMCSNDLMMK